MAHWNEAAVTNTGVELLNEWMAGRKLTITAAYGGTGTVEADKLPEQTGLVNQKQKLSLLGKEDSKTGVTVQVQVNNLGLEEEYELNQVMVMAALDRDKDPDSEEKCLFIMQDQKGVDIPAEDDDEVFLLELYCAIGITNNGRFAVSVDTTGIVSISRMSEAIKKAIDAHNADQEAHGGILGGQEQQYSAEKTYKAGAYCNKDGKLYKCKEDITEPEEWNPEHWDATTVTKELEGTQVTADKATETAEKAVEEALEQITTSPVAESLADSDAFATVTAAGIKRTPLSLLKQVFGKLFAPAPLSKDLTLYVSTTGNDSNDGLSTGTAKRTIQSAIDAVPKNLGGHKVVIEIADGDYTEQAPRLYGFFGGADREGYSDILLLGTSRKGTILGNIASVLPSANIGISRLSVRTERASGIYCKGNAHIWDVTVDITCPGYSYAVGVGAGIAIVHDIEGNTAEGVGGRCIANSDSLMYAYNISGVSDISFGVGQTSPYTFPSLTIISQNHVTANNTKYSKANGAIIFEDGVQV